MNAIFIEDWGKAAAAMLNKREFDRFCGLFVRFAIGDEFTDEDKKTRAYKLFDSLKIGEKTLKSVQKYEQKCAKTVEKRIKNDEKKIVQNADTQDTLLGKTKTKTITNTNILERENRERHTPTIDEVKELCKKENYNFDPLKFYTHYASLGWMVNGQQVIDWKARAAIWQATQKEHNNNNNKKNNNHGRDKNNNDGFSGTGYIGDTI